VRKYGALGDSQQRMLEFMDDRSFAEFIGPLPEDVHSLFRATLTRSSGEPEDIAAGYGVGYFHLVWNRGAGLSRNIAGGSSRVIEALASGLGDRVRTGTPVTEVRREGDGVRVRYDGGELTARAAIVATPAYVTREIVRDLPEDTAAALDAIPYGPFVVGAFLTNEPDAMPWDGIYALATPQRSFSMLFNTANVLRGGQREPGGSLMVYAAAGYARALAGLDDLEVAARFSADLIGVFPEARGIVDEVEIQRWEQGLPYPRPGRAQLQPALTRPLGPIHLAGDYFGTWYTETAVQTGTAAAAAAARA
jgi:oxygen-dependent protoporphyrinogen oxidase